MSGAPRRRGIPRGAPRNDAPATPQQQAMIPTPRLTSVTPPSAVQVAGVQVQQFVSSALQESTAPTLQLDHPFRPGQQGTVRQIWNDINKNDRHQVDQFLYVAQRTIQTLGQTSANLAFEVISLKDESSVLQSILNSNKNTYQEIEALAKKEKDRRDRKAQCIRRLLERSQPKSAKFRSLQNYYQNTLHQDPPQDLGPWTSEAFLKGLVIPYVGNSTTTLDAIIESRVSEHSHSLTPLQLLQRASFNMVMRLSGRMGQVTQDQHPTPGDIRNISTRNGDYNNKQQSMAEPGVQETLRSYNLREVHGIFFIGGIPPRNYNNLVASEGKPDVVVRAESYVSRQINQGLLPGQSIASPPSQRRIRGRGGGNRGGQRGRGSGIASAAPARNTAPPRNVRSPSGAPSSGSTSLLSDAPSPTSASEAGSEIGGASLVLAEAAVRNANNSRLQSPTPNPPRPKSNLPLATAPEPPQSTVQQSAMGGAVRGNDGIWRSGSAAGQQPKTVNSTASDLIAQFQKSADLATSDDQTSLPPLGEATKRMRSTLTPLSSTATPSAQSPAAKKARPEKHTSEDAINEIMRNVGRNITKFEKTKSPPSNERSPYPNPIKEPTEEQRFAWHLVKQYAEALQDELRTPELTEDEVNSMKSFGIKKMIKAYKDIAQGIPGRYKRSHQYLAERGILSKVREMERAINEKRGTMKSVWEALQDWANAFGGHEQPIRGGNMNHGGTTVNYIELQTFLFSGEFHNGWLSGNVITAAIAAHRPLNADDGINYIPFHSWNKFVERKTQYPDYWGEKETNMRYIIVHERRHWFLMVVNGAEHWYAVLDSLFERNSQDDEHLVRLEEFLRRILGWQNMQRRYAKSKDQFNNYDCGVWVCMNAIAIMNGGLGAVVNVDVDHYTRTELIRKIHEAVIIEQCKPGTFSNLPRIGPQPIPEKANVITLEDEVEGKNAKKLMDSGI